MELLAVGITALLTNSLGGIIAGILKASYCWVIGYAVAITAFSMIFRSGYIQQEVLTVFAGYKKLTADFIGRLASGFAVGFFTTLIPNTVSYFATKWFVS